MNRDIKLDNIYLDAPNRRKAGAYPDYPRPVLGDMGLGILTSEDAPLNPLTYNGKEGTPRFMPPERFPMHNRNSWQPDPIGKLNSATNVWQIGAAIIALMNRVGNPESLNYVKGEDQPKLKEHTNRYSKELRTLVQNCTSYWPDQRIALEKLRDRIEELTGQEAIEDFSLGMRWPQDGVDAVDEQVLRYS